MISMLILTVGILATTQMQLSFIQSNNKANIMTQGATAAQEKVEELVDTPFDDGDPLNFGPMEDRTGDGAAGLDNIGNAADSTDTIDGYTFFWNVSDDDPVAGMKTIKIFVQWNDEKNVQRQVDYTLFRSNFRTTF